MIIDELMTYETIEKQMCSTCKKIQFCVLIDLDWYCEYCYSWTKEYAEVKDKTRKIMIDFGLEDLDRFN